MAETNGESASCLIDQLKENPSAFRFYQAVRLLENAQNDSLPRVGFSRGPEQDSVRFGQYVSLAHLGTDIKSYRSRKNESLGEVHELKVCFTGLAGPFGPMPEWFTETLVHLEEGIPDERLFSSSDGSKSLYKGVTVKDQTLQDFVDLFHNRFFALLYRSWAAGNKAVDFDRSKHGEECDLTENGSFSQSDQTRFTGYLSSFFGDWHEHQTGGDLRPFSKLAFAGYLSGQTRHAEGLESILSTYFRVKVEVEQFVGHWLPIEQEQQTSLGRSREPKQLGIDTFVGKRVWDRQLKFRIKAGPLNNEEFHNLLPGSHGYQELTVWVKTYVGERLIWDLQLIIAGSEVPNAFLGQCGTLGQSLWLKSMPMKSDNGDVILNPQAA